MPHIIVQYEDDVAERDGGWLLGQLRKELRYACKVLSVPGRQLQSNDFSFMFLKAGEWDSLVCDIQVIILAHADRQRVERLDKLAEEIAATIGEVIRRELKHEAPDVTYSVSLHLGEMGYFADFAKLVE